MKRTRITFFAILGALLAIIATSMALRLVDASAILPLYVAATVFSLGIVALDFMGILGEDQSDDAGAFGEVVDVDGFDVDGFDVDGFDAGGIDVDAVDVDVEVEAVPIDADGIDFEAGDPLHGHTGGHTHDLTGYDVNYRRGGLIISLLSYLRLTVYFCLGFGPTGWVALSTGRGALASLGLASGMGIVALFLALTFFRFQRSDTDSSLKQTELLQAPAVVTIPLSHTVMGKVRIHLGMNVSEQYALAMQPDTQYKTGDRVHILRVTDECVYVA